MKQSWQVVVLEAIACGLMFAGCSGSRNAEPVVAPGNRVEQMAVESGVSKVMDGLEKGVGATHQESIWLTLPRQKADDIEPDSLRARNLIFISIDALQAAHVGALGYERNTTPTLDALASCSYQFSHCFSVASWTVPASMTWFTGVYPSEHQLVNKFAVYNDSQQTVANLSSLSPELVTLAELLRQQGYRTAGFTGNAGVSGVFGYNQGFDTYQHEVGKFGTFEYSVPLAINWLESIGSHPFFLFLHGYDAHGQAMPSSGYDYRFVDPEYDWRYSGTSQEQEYLREEGLDRGRLELRESDLAFWRSIYDEKIQRADSRLEFFFRELARLGLLENTLIVVTSDHGTEFGEHGRFDHGFTLYNEQIHVPLWIHLPRQSEGIDIPGNVSSIDLMPTLLELLEIEPVDEVRGQLRGVSLVGAMRGHSEARDLFCETDYREFTFKRAVISPANWKLIYSLETRQRELYDLNRDACERQDLARSEPEIADELERRLFEHFRAIGCDLRARSWEPGLNPVYQFPDRK